MFEASSSWASRSTYLPVFIFALEDQNHSDIRKNRSQEVVALPINRGGVPLLGIRFAPRQGCSVAF
jgi:hypothetical protein